MSAESKYNLHISSNHFLYCLHLKTILIYVFSILLISCNKFSQSKEQIKSIYNVQIDYMSSLHEIRMCKLDSVILCFDGNYNNDTIEFFMNGNFVDMFIIKADEQSGRAGAYKFEKRKEIKNIGIRMNNGNLIYIDNLDHNILFFYENNFFLVRFYNKIPAAY